MAAASAFVLFGLQADAPVEDIEYVLGDAMKALSRIDSKRAVLQEQIVAASRGKRRASRTTRPTPAVVTLARDDDNVALYTRKGAGAIRRRLTNAARHAKKERKRLEAVCGGLEEALVDAEEFMALHREATA